MKWNFDGDKRSLGPDLNLRPSAYETALVSTLLRCSVPTAEHRPQDQSVYDSSGC